MVTKRSDTHSNVIPSVLVIPRSRCFLLKDVTRSLMLHVYTSAKWVFTTPSLVESQSTNIGILSQSTKQNKLDQHLDVELQCKTHQVEEITLSDCISIKLPRCLHQPFPTTFQNRFILFPASSSLCHKGILRRSLSLLPSILLQSTRASTNNCYPL